MTNLYIFSDEAGCFTFKRSDRVSKYFILCTVSMNNCNVGDALLELRRNLIWEGYSDILGDYFHATSDKQVIRNRVYETICRYDFNIQATIMEKAKAQSHIIDSRPKFYKYGWFYHFKHGMRSIVDDSRKVLVSAASLGNKKEKLSFSKAIDDVIGQTVNIDWETDFRSCKADPCLQVADYCAWAIQRKWEKKGCNRSYDLIKDRITREYDLWQKGTKLYY